MAVIKQKQVVDDNFFENFNKSAAKGVEGLKAMSTEARELLGITVEMAKQQKVNSEGARTLAKLDKESADAMKRKVDADKQLIALEKQKTQLLSAEETLKQKKIRTEQQELRIAKKKESDTKKAIALSEKQNSQYSKDSALLRKLKNDYKNVALSQGLTSKAAKSLLKDITPLDKKLKELDRTVGDNYRDIGNYERALGGLKSTLGKLGVFFGVREIINFGKQLNTVAQQAQGVQFAFERLGTKGEDSFNRVKTSMRGLLGDLDIKKALVNFDNFNISLEETDTLMEFLAVRSTQTGESIEKLQSSLVEGLSKESKLRIDNLGISAAQLNEELKRTPNFVQAVANIAKSEIAEAGDILDSAASGQQKWNAQLQNFQLLLANKVKPIFDTAFDKGAKILEFVGNNLETIIPLIVKIISTIGLYKVAMVTATTASNLFGKSVSKLKNIFGLASLALTGAIFLVNELIKSWKEGATAANLMSRMTDKVNVGLIEEQANLELLWEKLKLTNTASEERQSLLDDANKKYGLTLKNLENEADFVNQIADAYATLIGQMEAKLEAEVRQDFFKNLLGQRADLEKELKKTEGNSLVNNLVKETLADVNAQIELLKGTIVAAGDLDNVSRGGSGGGGKSVSPTKKTTEEIDQMVKMIDIGRASYKEYLEDLSNRDPRWDLESRLRQVIEIDGEDVLFSQNEYEEMVDGFDFVAEEIVKTSKLSKDEIDAIFNSARKTLEATEKILQRNQERKLQDIDTLKQRQQEAIEDSRKAEDRIREEARLRGLDPTESLNREREARKRAELEQLRLDKERLKILKQMATYQLIISGLSVAEAGVQLKQVSEIEGFYKGTDRTLGDELGYTGKKDAHLIYADENEAIFNPNQTKDLGIGKGGNTTQDIVDMYKGGILGAQAKSALLGGMLMEGVQIESDSAVLSRKMDKLIVNTDPSNRPIDSTTFNTATGLLEHTHRSAKKRAIKTYKVRS